MVEHMQIKDKDVWISVAPHVRDEADKETIPTEYFTASYKLNEADEASGTVLQEAGAPKLFVSPVAAVEYAREYLVDIL